MNEIKSLADQLRNKLSDPVSLPTKRKKEQVIPSSQLVQALLAYNNTDHKNMVHIRFDQTTAQMLSYFKLATGVEVTKLVAFAMKDFLTRHPEIKSITQQYLQNLKL